jgi:hypothetical protein
MGRGAGSEAVSAVASSAGSMIDSGVVMVWSSLTLYLPSARHCRAPAAQSGSYC